jgi:hypothetical protein
MKTYKDFKVGDVLTCVKLNSYSIGGNYIGDDKDNERLIIGGKYKVTDVDYHFHNKVCVKLIGPYYFHEEFVPIECFVDLAGERDLKLSNLGI